MVFLNQTISIPFLSRVLTMEIPLILYRWITDADISTYGNQLSLVDAGLIGRPDAPRIGAWVESGRYAIAPIGRQMTVGEYLSPGMGVGGNIVGFFQYIEDWSRRIKESSPGYQDMASTKSTFGWGRHLLIIPMAYYDGPPILKCGAGLEDTVVNCPGFLKIANLGALIETPLGSYGQDAEWNLIPGERINLPAIIVRFGRFDTDDSFIVDATATEGMDYDKFLQLVKDIVDAQVSKTPARASASIRIDECPEVQGGRRKTRKQRRGKKGKSHRNILPKVVGS